jgi:hypothetical protein
VQHVRFDLVSNVKCQHMSTCLAIKRKRIVYGENTMVRKRLQQPGLAHIQESAILVIDHVIKRLDVIILHVFAVLSGVGSVERNI